MELKRSYFTTFGYGEKIKHAMCNLTVDVMFRTHAFFVTINESIMLKWN